MHLFNSYLSVRNVQENVFHKLFSTVFHVKQHQNHMNYEHTHRPCHIHYANSYKKCCKQNTVLFIFVSSSPRKKVYLGTPSPHIFYLHHMTWHCFIKYLLVKYHMIITCRQQRHGSLVNWRNIKIGKDIRKRKRRKKRHLRCQIDNTFW